MLKMLVDTCTWQHWFSSKKNLNRLTSDLVTQCESFDEIYNIVSLSSNAKFLYNALVRHELGTKYQTEFEQYILPVAAKIPIPLSRFDGLYLFDGSILMGGRMGGSLREFLTFDGYPQDQKIIDAASKLRNGESLYETKPRKRELDVEHMESALEVEADIFITNDESTIIKRLEIMSEHFDKEHAINKILSITKTPQNALPLLKKLLQD